MIFSGLCVTVLAQEKLFTESYHPNKKQASIAGYLQDINRQTGIVIEYASGNFDINKKVRLDKRETSVGAALQKILKGQMIKMIVHNNKIIIIPSSTPFIAVNSLPSQYRLYGYIKEKGSDEPLISSTIYEPATQHGTFSNDQGYFNLWLSEGEHVIKISYAGLQPRTLKLNLQDNRREDIALEMRKSQLATVVVKPGAASMEDGSINPYEEQFQSGNLNNNDDPLGYLYLYPGLQNSSYSFTSFQVRGGGADENLFLLDGNRIYNPTHLLGAISIINPTVLKSIRLYKSDFPARLGGSISSVIEVSTKQGNMKNWHGEVNAGLLAGSLTLEGPLVKDKVSLMLSARKSISLPFYQSLQDGLRSDFYDLHFRMSGILSTRNKLAFNLYKGEDKIKQTGKHINNFHNWGNIAGSIKLTSLLGSATFINTSANFTRYKNLDAFQYTLFDKEEDEDTESDNEVNEDEGETKYIGAFSSLKNYNIKSTAAIYISPKLKLNAGARLSRIIIKPFDSKVTNKLKEDEDEDDFISFDPLQFETLAIYSEAEINLGGKLFVKPGVRAAAYQFNDYRTIMLQPRFLMVYHISPLHRIYASYSKLNQFLHLVTNPYAGVNGDIWVPSTKTLIPEGSEIYNIGYSYQYRPAWKFSIEGYYKRMTNVTNYAEGKSMFINSDDWRNNIESGTGWSYGTEIMIKRHNDKFSWQAGYALSWSWRQFKSINGGNKFPYKYDHRHAINAGVSYSLSSHMDVSGLWSLTTGNIYSAGGLVFVDSVQQVPGAGKDPLEDYQFIYHYSKQNQYRAKSYQRYDVSLTYHSRKGQKLYSLLKAGVYNINGADDQYSHNLRGALNTKSIRVKTSSSVFHLIPYLSYTLKF